MNNSHIQWAINFLNNNGYLVHSSIPDIIQDNPWSVVCRFETNQGFVFLKKVPIALSLEPRIINILYSEFHANVPVVIGENQELRCFLMSDAGIPLHEHLKQSIQTNILIQAMHDYTALQIMTSGKVKLFLDMGVPDWRVEKLPALYQDLIAQENLLLDDGLSKDDLINLKKLAPKFSSMCERLSQYEVKDTFGHADFHDKNILININTGQTTLIDLGEVVITHPFFSFLNCLHRAKENFSLTDTQYQQLQVECFKPWFVLDTQANLFEILAIIQKCWSIHSVLGEFRLINSVDQQDFQKLSRQGRLAANLRHWINQ
jgi:hypothetical protein